MYATSLLRTQSLLCKCVPDDGLRCMPTLQVRMTWGKALLPWTSDAGKPCADCSFHIASTVRFYSEMVLVVKPAGAETALKHTIHLNHKFALDGCDPSSYGGILWCYGEFDGPKGSLVQFLTQ